MVVQCKLNSTSFSASSPRAIFKNLIQAKEHSNYFLIHGERRLLERSAIVLAGGFSTRLGHDKGLVKLMDKPLVRHVLDKTKNLVDETLIIVSSDAQAEKYKEILQSHEDVKVDNAKAHGPLAGAAVGFQEASGKYSLLLPCDAPLVSKKILQLLLELCVNRNAVIPRWPSSYIEPLQAVYCTEAALRASEEALSSGEVKMQAMVDRLRGVRYVSTLVLEQLDSELNTFFNVNTALDLKKAETILKRK
jgi:molybdopterin-guanine dinucleotide biosynthesis protein A